VAGIKTTSLSIRTEMDKTFKYDMGIAMNGGSVASGECTSGILCNPTSNKDFWGKCL
jgi:hypothetical protein